MAFIFSTKILLRYENVQLQFLEVCVCVCMCVCVCVCVCVCIPLIIRITEEDKIALKINGISSFMPHFHCHNVLHFSCDIIVRWVPQISE